MEFKNKDIEQTYQNKTEHIKKLIDGAVEDTKQYFWDETVGKYATKIEQIRRVLSDEIISEDKDEDIKNITNELKAFLSRCSSPEFQVALVGTIKAGKSTLINALLNYELASTRVTPETAALTKFKHASEDFVEISFYNQDEWAALWKSATSATNSVFVEDYNNLHADDEKPKWLNHTVIKTTFNDRNALKDEIVKWTSSKSPTHYFVKEVTVGLQNFDLPEGVVLIDTPGLNDVVTFRSDITRSYIDRANAVFMCVKSDSLTGEELQTLYRVFINTKGKLNKVYVIATQLDTLNKPKDDWQKQREEWTKYLLGDSAYKKNINLVNSNLIPVSAYLYTMLEKYRNDQLSNDDYFDLQSILLKMRIREAQLGEHFLELVEFTNIKPLFHKLQTEVVAKHKEELIDDLIRAYDNCKKDLQKIMKQKKQGQEKIIADSQKGIEDIRRERDQKIKELQEVQKTKEGLEVFVKKIKEETAKNIDYVVEAIKGSKSKAV